MTQAHANRINRPGRGRSLPRQLPPKNGGVMKLSLIGKAALLDGWPQSGPIQQLRASAPMSFPLTPINVPASWSLCFPASTQRRYRPVNVLR